jgi:hypothetical protein
VWILQNIAAWHPRLWGHLRPHVICTVGLRWPASSWPFVLLPFSSFTRGKLASLTEKWACIVHGPIVSDLSKFHLWCKGRRARRETRWHTLWFCQSIGAKSTFQVPFRPSPSQSVRAWRTATRRRTTCYIIASLPGRAALTSLARACEGEGISLVEP